MRRIGVFLVLTALLSAPARGDLLRRAFREGLEYLTGKGRKEAAEAVAGRAARSVARHGDDVVRATARHGDDAMRALARHEGVAAPLIKRWGASAVPALNAVGPRNGRRMAMMLDAGEFEQMGRTPELLAIVGKYADPAMEFIWRHKGALAVSAGLAAFLSDPKPFIDGTRDLTSVVAENSVRPVAKGAGDALREVGRPAAWLMFAAAAMWLGKQWLRKK
jgi:hypothetical protein